MSAFATYQQLTCQTVGMETTAQLEPAGFAVALQHPEVIRVEAEGHTLPFAVPLNAFSDQFNWVNTDYFARNHGLTPKQPFYLAVLPPGDYAAAPDAAAMLQELHQENGLLFVEYPARPGSETERAAGTAHLQRLLGRAGLTTSDESKDHRHYHYMNLLTPPQETDLRDDPAIEALYDADQSLSETERPEGIAVERIMTEADVDTVWGFYEPGHDRISKYDPVTGGFKQNELHSVLTNPEILKFISRQDGNIVNIALVTDIRSTMVAALTNPAYFARHHAADYDAGRIMFSPGLFRDARAKSLAGITSEATMGHIGDMIKRARVAPWLGYACNLTSNRVVPRLSHTVFPGRGLRVDNIGAVSEQSFGIYRLAPSA